MSLRCCFPCSSPSKLSTGTSKVVQVKPACRDIGKDKRIPVGVPGLGSVFMDFPWFRYRLQILFPALVNLSPFLPLANDESTLTESKHFML